MESLSASLIELSTTLGRLMLHDYNRQAHASGRSLAQMQVLVHLYYHPDLAMSEFSRHLTMAPNAASQMIDRLVKDGLVERAESSSDHRVRTIHLSPAGRQVVDEVLAARQDWFEQSLCSLPEPDRAALQAALTTLNTHLSNLPDPLPGNSSGE